MTLPSQEDELKQALIRIAKRKGHYDKSFTNYLVTVEELLPELSALIAKARIEELEQIKSGKPMSWGEAYARIDNRISELKDGDE